MFIARRHVSRLFVQQSNAKQTELTFRERDALGRYQRMRTYLLQLFLFMVQVQGTNKRH